MQFSGASKKEGIVISRQHRAVVATVLALCQAPLPAYAPGAHDPGTRYLVFFDFSSSVTERDRGRWASWLKSNVIQRLRPGDALTMFPVHDRTLAAAALFTGASAPLPRDPGIDAAAASARAVARMRAGAAAALDKALAEQAAKTNQTDLLSLLDRYEADVTGRIVVVVILSDGLHAGVDANFESQRITDIPAVLKRLSAQRRWKSDQLMGAHVYCVLNGEVAGQAQPANDRRTLKAFYEALFAAVGARLMRFDTDVDLSETRLSEVRREVR
jgi:hypothetical protein